VTIGHIQALLESRKDPYQKFVKELSSLFSDGVFEKITLEIFDSADVVSNKNDIFKVVYSEIAEIYIQESFAYKSKPVDHKFDPDQV